MDVKQTSISYQHVSPELRLYSGVDSLVALRRELDRHKCGRAVVVCGATVGRSNALVSLLEQLNTTVVKVSTSARENSPLSGVEATAEAIREHEADAIIAVGGGSSAVTARAAAILVAEGKPLSALSTRRLSDGSFDSPRLNAPKLPLFVVPTTPSTSFVKAGTAIHDDKGQRLAMYDPKTRAKAIFVHPDFLETAPTSLVLSAALNTFSTGIEALESPRCDPISEALLMQSTRLISQGLHYLRDNDTSIRERLVVAGILCGRGTEQTGAGLASVISHSIGHRSHVANGIVNAIMLPHTMRYNAVATVDRANSILESMGSRAMNSASRPEDVVEQFLRSLPVPKRLSEIGVSSGQFDEIASAAMEDWFITRAARPVSNSSTLTSILDAAL
jgi:alcohol dehydrogenase